jgi:RNA polymerase sigma factor (sigma-70 family)
MSDAEFERLYSECFGALQRYCYFKLPSKADGDDVLQDVALSAWSNRGNIKSSNSFKPWLLRIAANKCNDFYRRRAKQVELPIDELTERADCTETESAHTETVRETLDALTEPDSRMLAMFYLNGLPQTEIGARLNIPLGTVKSRLHTARERFRRAYPLPPPTHKKLQQKGTTIMSNSKKLPEILPEYTIEKSSEPLFDVKWEEMMGWFVVPRLGETCDWAIYDYPACTISEQYSQKVIGLAAVHGVAGVEIISTEHRGGEHEGKPESREVTREFVAQLTDTHCRILSEIHPVNGVKTLHTFLDGDAFLGNWGFGEDNCGKDIYPKPRGLIKREGNIITCQERADLLDVIGRYTVTFGGNSYDTILVMDCDCYNNGVASEQYIDRNGRTVLWRRFNRDDWHLDRYKQLWSEKLPDNERLTINGETYVHWYDCITDYAA